LGQDAEAGCACDRRGGGLGSRGRATDLDARGGAVVSPRILDREAVWWRDASILYFQTSPGMRIPPGYEPPEHPLQYHLDSVSRHAPGT
jgi:hypothetical protein